MTSLTTFFTSLADSYRSYFGGTSSLTPHQILDGMMSRIATGGGMPTRNTMSDVGIGKNMLSAGDRLQAALVGGLSTFYQHAMLADVIPYFLTINSFLSSASSLLISAATTTGAPVVGYNSKASSTYIGSSTIRWYYNNNNSANGLPTVYNTCLEFHLPNMTFTLTSNYLSRASRVEYIDLPAVTSVSYGSLLSSCSNIKYIRLGISEMSSYIAGTNYSRVCGWSLPNLISFHDNYAFSFVCSNVHVAVFPKLEYLQADGLGAKYLTSLYLLNSTQVVSTAWFNPTANTPLGTPVTSGNYETGYMSVYVPSHLYNAYRDDPFWSSFPDRLVPLNSEEQKECLSYWSIW